MPKEINCEKVRENIDKLKILKNEFLVEMERIKKDGIAGNIYKLKKKIEDVKGFLDDELKEYLLTEKEKEEMLNKELEKYLVKGKDNLIDLTDASQKLKDGIINWKGSIYDDCSNDILYCNLQATKGYLYAQNTTTFSANSLKTINGDLRILTTTTFSANSLKTVKGEINAENVTIFFANSLQTVEKIFLKRSNFKKFFDDNDNFDWEQAKKEGKLILPKETRGKVGWRGWGY